MNRYPAVVPLADISIARTNVSTGANKENQASGLIRFPLFSNEKLGLFFWQNQWGFCPIRS